MITARSYAFARLHVIYTIKCAQLGKHIIYIGLCPLAELHNLPDARHNSEFERIVKADDDIEVAIWSGGSDIDVMTTAHEQLVKTLKPHCNIGGTPIIDPTKHHAPRGPIHCVELQTQYPSAAAAAKVFGVTSSAMSQHLAGSVRTIGGYRFKRGALPK